jgi:hypothetical protein
MVDRRRGKIFIVGWEEWCETCEGAKEDPWEAWENGGGEMAFDLGGGDSYTIRLDGEPPNRD